MTPRKQVYSTSKILYFKELVKRSMIQLSASNQILYLALSQEKKSGFPDGSVVKNLPANGGDADSIPGLGRSPGKGNGNPLLCCILTWEIPWTEETGRATFLGVTKVRQD